MAAVYDNWRVTLHEKFTGLHKALTEEFDSETFCRLPDKELDWKFDAWERLQNAVNSTAPPAIFNDRDNWPQWLVAVMKVLMTRDPDRLCRDVLTACIEHLKPSQ